MPKKYEQHKCGYCGKAAYGFCVACFPFGCTPTHAICGPSAGTNCMQQHCNGVPPRFGMHKRAAMEDGSSSGGTESAQPKRQARM